MQASEILAAVITAVSKIFIIQPAESRASAPIMGLFSQTSFSSFASIKTYTSSAQLPVFSITHLLFCIWYRAASSLFISKDLFILEMYRSLEGQIFRIQLHEFYIFNSDLGQMEEISTRWSSKFAHFKARESQDLLQHQLRKPGKRCWSNVSMSCETVDGMLYMFINAHKEHQVVKMMWAKSPCNASRKESKCLSHATMLQKCSLQNLNLTSSSVASLVAFLISLAAVLGPQK